jgi:acyl carrier protein
MREQVLQGIESVARTHLGWRGDLRPDMHLVEDLELDSLRLLTLAVEVENHFQICLEEEDEAAIETVRDLVGVVVEKLAGRKEVR